MNRVETKIFHLAIESAAKFGWTLVGVDDGGDDLIHTSDPVEAVAAADSVEACTVYFKNEHQARAHIDFIWGNGHHGLQCLLDHTTNLQEALAPVDDWIDFAESTSGAELVNMGYDLDELDRDNPYNQG